MNYVPPKRSDGTIQRRRKPLPWPPDRPFKILAIDGGGIRGILPASVLAELENRFLNGRTVADHFDMIAGTSTGGIIALALAHGLTAREIQKFYVERGGLVFPPSNVLGRMWRWLRRLHRYAYDSGVLEQELLGIFGDTPLGDARTRLCIPSFEGVHGEPWIYKTPHHPDYRKDRVERMVKVRLATSAAPTYYKAMPNNGYIMVDGGLWANNPIMNAVTDALACYDVDRSQVRVLSLGCGETSFRVDPVKAVGGMFQWKGAILAAMRAQSLNALGQTFMLIGKENVVRLDAPETPTPIQLDGHQRAKVELPAMARALVEGSGHLVESLFLTETVAPYVPSVTTRN
ncbi:CBASS cGAMP-activated phospholipase [Acidisphaera sp. S103]|uniref:CBASS cGAMP-activated phospholipase n=1 Tax=Acidisphaera sp. S103 TaxID=1747223 RepID=UPI00131E68EB|nr:CBASS cGAMP-activated phospholipase [Acidisphaera sp. S103]